MQCYRVGVCQVIYGEGGMHGSIGCCKVRIQRRTTGRSVTYTIDADAGGIWGALNCRLPAAWLAASRADRLPSRGGDSWTWTLQIIWSTHSCLSACLNPHLLSAELQTTNFNNAIFSEN